MKGNDSADDVYIVSAHTCMRTHVLHARVHTAALQAEHMQMGGSSKGWTSSPSGPPCPFGLPICGSTIQSLSVFVSPSFRSLFLFLSLFSSL